jgi:hypothetical protein
MKFPVLLSIPNLVAASEHGRGAKKLNRKTDAKSVAQHVVFVSVLIFSWLLVSGLTH